MIWAIAILIGLPVWLYLIAGDEVPGSEADSSADGVIAGDE